MDRFNSMFITMSNERDPIWYYNVSDGDLKIDVHVQSISFELGKHIFIMSAKTDNGTNLLSSEPMEIVTNNQQPVFVDSDKNTFGAGEFIFYIEMTKDDISKIGKHLTINVKMDDKVEGTFVLLMRNDNNG